MPEKPHPTTPPAPGPKARPGQDIVMVKRQASQFPAVGMTLNTYQQGQRAQQRRGVAKIAKGGRVRRFFKSITLKRAVASLAIVALLIGGWLGGKFVYELHKIFGGSIFGVLSTTKLKGEDVGRVNILLAGNSADDPGHGGANLTDSIMILSIDTKNNTAFLLSIPRDLWVNIPRGGFQKINATYVVGQESNFNHSGYPQGGMGLLEQIVEQDFGLSLNYYALIDYSAFRDSVNSVGGIQLNIHSNDPRGLYDPSTDWTTHGPLVKLSNGPHSLNGQQALDLARARGDAYGSYGFAGSDFSRTQNQRDMLVALKSKAVSAGVLANPAKLSSLAGAIGNNVTTDMKLSEVHRLYDLVKPIKSSNIQSLSLNNVHGKNLLTSYHTADGESALVPAQGIQDFGAIQAFVRQQTSSNSVVRENAEIVVLNGTTTSGLASQKRTYLTTKNLNVTAIGDALAPQAATAIIDNSNGKKPATRQLLKQLFGGNFTTANPYTNTYPADFIVLLGNDQANTGNGTPN